MKHFVDDGRGCREVWLDGVLLDHVVECDTDTAIAVIACQPIRPEGDGIALERIHGDTLVVRSIENDKNSI